MLQQAPHVLLEVPDDVRVGIEHVLPVLVDVTDTVVLLVLDVGLSSPAEEVLYPAVEVVPLVSQRHHQPQAKLPRPVHREVQTDEVLLHEGVAVRKEGAVPAHVVGVVVSGPSGYTWTILVPGVIPLHHTESVGPHHQGPHRLGRGQHVVDPEPARVSVLRARTSRSIRIIFILAEPVDVYSRKRESLFIKNKGGSSPSNKRLAPTELENGGDEQKETQPHCLTDR